MTTFMVKFVNGTTEQFEAEGYYADSGSGTLRFFTETEGEMKDTAFATHVLYVKKAEND